MMAPTLWNQLLQDTRYAVRTMVAHPLITLMCTLSLALGIGANAAIYSFLDAMLLRALPVPQPESLIVLKWHSRDSPRVAHRFTGNAYKDARAGFITGNFPFPAYELLAQQYQICSSLFAFRRVGPVTVSIRDQADMAYGEYVSGNFFSGLGISASVGRLIESDDDRSDAEPVIVLSYGYAQRHFGTIVGAIGQPVLVNNTAFTVVGVADPRFFGVNPAYPTDVFVPIHKSLPFDSLSSDDANKKYIDKNMYWVEIMGRLRTGTTLEQAQAALAPVFRSLVVSSIVRKNEGVDLPELSVAEGAGGLDLLRRRYSQPLYLLMVLVGLILMIACANVANLLVAHTLSRRGELALKFSLGASRLRVLRQLLTESVLLALLGGAFGVLLAKLGMHMLGTIILRGDESPTVHADLNWHVFAFALLLSLGVGILFGLFPCLQSAQMDLSSALKHSQSSGHRPRLFSVLRVSPNHVLICGQIAVTLVFLATAGLFLRTLANLNGEELGFNRDNVLLFTINPKQAGYDDPALGLLYQNLQDRIGAIPGVRNLSVSSLALISGSNSSTDLSIPGLSVPHSITSVLYVSKNFFTTMQIPILLGRDLDQRDLNSATSVAVVNEKFVKSYFGGENPVGRRIGVGRSTIANIEIIGVSKNARYDSMKDDTPPIVYISYTQNLSSIRQMVFEVRTALAPLTYADTVLKVVHQTAPRVPISGIETQAAQIDQTIKQERTFATLCGCFSIIALLIVCVGLYGTTTYSVTRRVKEFGIRAALGASPNRLIRMVLREVLILTLTGIAIGLTIAFSTFHMIQAFLFGTKSNDPLTFLMTSLGLILVASLCGMWPALRASRINPMIVLQDAY
jgi:macrolide transport system ATP-binding/permease protein